MDLPINKRIHFIGVGGISMSGLAEILHSRGYRVSGSDVKASGLTERLGRLGAEVYIGQSAGNITPDIGLVVHTAAVTRANPELAEAVARGLEVIDRAQLLGMLMSEYAYPVCVSGTHGKTTTTSMAAEIFIKSGYDPTVSVGGMLPSIGGNIRIGASGYFVAEACEYFDSFLKFDPYAGIILNVDFDHVDYFKDINQMRESFRKFARNIRPGGVLVINAGIDGLDFFTDGLGVRAVTYGKEGADMYASGVSFGEDGCAGFTPVYCGEALPRLRLSVPGEHNVSNALAAMAAALCMGLERGGVYRALAEYTGTERRFEIKGRFNGVLVIDDYAHHPTEIKATLSAARRTRHSRLWCVFQPHTFSRTRELLPELAAAFADADSVVITDIYAARELDTGTVHARDLAERISGSGKDCRYISGFENVEKFLSRECMPNDMLITMGAGDVHLIADALVK